MYFKNYFFHCGIISIIYEHVKYLKIAIKYYPITIKLQKTLINIQMEIALFLLPLLLLVHCTLMSIF